MSEIEKLEREISQTTASLTSKVDVIESRAQTVFSAAHRIVENPLLAAGLALGAGILVGNQLPALRKTLEPIAVEIITGLAREIAMKYLPKE